MPDDLASEHRDAAHLAQLAGKALLELRKIPSGSRDLGAAGDRTAHQLLVAELNKMYPDDPVRSEEGLEHISSAGRLWIVDPLDGTREYRELGRSDWAVHVALSIGGEPVVGAVALPALDMVLSTGQPPVLPPHPEGEPPRLVVSRTRPPDVAYEVTEAVDGVMIPMGSAGAKIAAVILGDADIYVHAGGQYEWDSCAPAAVALASGLHASRLDGQPLRYGEPDAWLPDLVVCRQEYAQAVLDITTSQGRPYW
jgi:3'(2'), 5'-bisphosphate nucleotidase